jgi:hypothetical protein
MREVTGKERIVQWPTDCFVKSAKRLGIFPVPAPTTLSYINPNHMPVPELSTRMVILEVARRNGGESPRAKVLTRMENQVIHPSLLPLQVLLLVTRRQAITRSMPLKYLNPRVGYPHQFHRVFQGKLLLLVVSLRYKAQSPQPTTGKLMVLTLLCQQPQGTLKGMISA